MPLSRDYLSTRAERNSSGVKFTPVAIIKETWTNPIAKVTNGFSASHAGAGVAGTTSMTLGGSLTSGGVGTNTHSRNIVITVTHGSAVVAMSGVITGTDRFGNGLTEAWSVTAGTTSKTFTGKKAFKTVTSITEVIAADASANTIIAGSGDVLGMNTINSTTSPVKEYAAGSLVTNGVFVAASTASTADPRGTYAPNTIPDAATTYIVYFLSEQPENNKGLA